jgi:hypothetical protein
MITLIHGDDTVSSRNFYISKKKQAAAPVTLEADRITLTDLIQALSGGGLFAEEKDIFIESLLTKKKKSAELTAILAELVSQTDANIYLWEGKELEKRTITSLKNVSNQLFKLPQSLFQFLDSLGPKNTRQLILFHKTIETTESEMVFFMLIRHFRLLLALSSPTADPIDEVKGIAPWQQTKLQKQMKLFTPDQLKRAYHKLYEIDLGVKTGSSPLPLISSIDIFLLEL